MLPGFGELALTRFELLLQFSPWLASPIDGRPRLRSRRTKTASACSALRPFASQGHLVDTVTGPFSVGPAKGRALSILTKPRDELATPHSITSSARASTVGGTSRPSAFAVIRLSARSNLVGCSTGISAGFAPRRILST